MHFEDLKKYSAPTVRLGISLVFLWFGINQVTNPEAWIAWLPRWTSDLFLEQASIVMINGTFEILLGSLLLIGIFTRWTALVLSLHLIGIASVLWYSDIAIRDLGLAIATLSIFFNGKDWLCLEERVG